MNNYIETFLKDDKGRTFVKVTIGDNKNIASNRQKMEPITNELRQRIMREVGLKYYTVRDE